MQKKHQYDWLMRSEYFVKVFNSGGKKLKVNNNLSCKPLEINKINGFIETNN